MLGKESSSSPRGDHLEKVMSLKTVTGVRFSGSWSLKSLEETRDPLVGHVLISDDTSSRRVWASTLKNRG